MRLIDADALINIFEDRLEKIRNRYGDYSGESGVCAGALHLIRVQPTIDPQRKTGKWIIHETENDRYDDMKCPFCKKSYTVDAYRIDDIGFTAADFNFCPNCGADMRCEDDDIPIEYFESGGI